MQFGKHHLHFNSSGTGSILKLCFEHNYFTVDMLFVLVKVLEDNAELAARVATKDLPVRRFLTVPVGGGYGETLHVLILPAYFVSVCDNYLDLHVA